MVSSYKNIILPSSASLAAELGLAKATIDALSSKKPKFCELLKLGLLKKWELDFLQNKNFKIVLLRKKVLSPREKRAIISGELAFFDLKNQKTLFQSEFFEFYSSASKIPREGVYNLFWTFSKKNIGQEKGEFRSDFLPQGEQKFFFERVKDLISEGERERWGKGARNLTIFFKARSSKAENKILICNYEKNLKNCIALTKLGKECLSARVVEDFYKILLNFKLSEGALEIRD